ncbi:hypothetical protein [Komagataeibacter sp. FNDCR2]|uniref:hypothetical protein n=1 Tax=Komagataeibacter sp. FNDCR2 TaxID=2878682 RepID=UPI001E592203|nr:hypothetical protein [Komagataeibacter sp. FNDCR2]MCE2574120.1 hypothetical protein [Komagataeibacter sp. FNDCR2]
MKLCSDRAALAIWLTWRDLAAEKTMAFCLLAGMTATLVPLLLLAGLRAGMVENMRHSLLADPHMREVASASNRPFSSLWLEQMKQRRDVMFLIPRTRTLAASVRITPPGGDMFSSEDAELMGTAVGDPLPGQAAIQAEFAYSSFSADLTAPVPAIFSSVLAAHLHAHIGETLTMSVTRLGQGLHNAEVPIVVRAISPRETTDRTVAFVPLGVAQGIEDFREETSSPSWTQALRQGEEEASQFLDIHQTVHQHPVNSNPMPGESSWPGFRLYASSLEAVQQLDAALLAQRINVTDEAGRVGEVLRLDKQTRLLLMLLAGLSVSGFLITLGTGVWASVERKRLELATMRFLGTPHPELLPIVQAEFLAFCSVTLALTIARISALILNHLFDGTLPNHAPVCLISWKLCLAATALTAFGALVVASAAAWKTSHIQPWDGVCAP